MGELFVKICGITTPDDALAAVAAGADAIGVNLIAGTPRAVEADVARSIVHAVARRALVVGVVADLPLESLQSLRAELGLGALQLHGSEPPDLLAALLPHAYKAVRIGAARDVALARCYGGDRLLVDAKVEGRLGGTGQSFDWSLVRELARERHLILAGGLSPENVANAVREAEPWGVDVASGVEMAGNPRRKDSAKLSAFVQAAKSA